LNYRHAYHAGNFADVMKHALLARMLVHLKAKDTAFRVIDVHGGAGIYDLADDKFNGAGEARRGIGRMEEALFAPAIEELLAPYRAAIAAARVVKGKSAYPGSPWIVRNLMREQDRLIAAELHEPTFQKLQAAIARDERSTALNIDGKHALRANIPPKERRGLVLIDPPFESRDEFQNAGDMLMDGLAKWPTGMFALWYPIKDGRVADAFAGGLMEGGLKRALRLEITVDEIGPDKALASCGLIIANPPWMLGAEAKLLLPALAERLAIKGRASYRCEALLPDG
jgi:23S rRNA (adenine2030-N6)-methyltransferase